MRRPRKGGSPKSAGHQEFHPAMCHGHRPTRGLRFRHQPGPCPWQVPGSRRRWRISALTASREDQPGSGAQSNDHAPGAAPAFAATQSAQTPPPRFPTLAAVAASAGLDGAQAGCHAVAGRTEGSVEGRPEGPRVRVNGIQYSWVLDRGGDGFVAAVSDTAHGPARDLAGPCLGQSGDEVDYLERRPGADPFAHGLHDCAREPIRVGIRTALLTTSPYRAPALS